MERASAAFLALGPDTPADEVDKLLANGEPETGTAIFACRRTFSLAEGFEDTLQVFLANADACVLNPEMHQALAVRSRCSVEINMYRSVGSELDGVSDQVRHHLAEPEGIAHHGVGRAGAHLTL